MSLGTKRKVKKKKTESILLSQRVYTLRIFCFPSFFLISSEIASKIMTWAKAFREGTGETDGEERPEPLLPFVLLFSTRNALGPRLLYQHAVPGGDEACAVLVWKGGRRGGA